MIVKIESSPEEKRLLKDIITAANGEGFAKVPKEAKRKFAERVLLKIPGRQKVIEDANATKLYCTKLSRSAEAAATALRAYRKLRSEAPKNYYHIVTQTLLADREIDEETLKIVINKLRIISRLGNARRPKTPTERARNLALSIARYYREAFGHEPEHHHSFSSFTYRPALWSENPPSAFDMICLAVNRYTGIKFSEEILREAAPKSTQGENKKPLK